MKGRVDRPGQREHQLLIVVCVCVCNRYVTAVWCVTTDEGACGPARQRERKLLIVVCVCVCNRYVTAL